MDEFSAMRALRLIGSFKKTHGRDISEAELMAHNISAADLAELIKKGAVDKYQVTNKNGSVENRFKAHRDWRSLNA